MNNNAEYDIAIWNLQFYKIDKNGNALLNEDGNIKLFEANNLDHSFLAEGIDNKDLTEKTHRGVRIMTNIYVPNVDVPLLRQQYEELCEFMTQTPNHTLSEGLLNLLEEMLYIADDEYGFAQKGSINHEKVNETRAAAIMKRKQDAEAALALRVIVPVKQKACNTCFVVKPAADYCNNKSKEDGLQSSCAVCQRRKNNEWRKRKRLAIEAERTKKMNFLIWTEKFGKFTVHPVKDLELPELQKSHANKTNWTLCVDGDGTRVIVNGFMYVNRECFLITKKAWDADPYDIEITEPWPIADPQGGYY